MNRKPTKIPQEEVERSEEMMEQSEEMLETAETAPQDIADAITRERSEASAKLRDLSRQKAHDDEGVRSSAARMMDILCFSNPHSIHPPSPESLFRDEARSIHPPNPELIALKRRFRRS